MLASAAIVAFVPSRDPGKARAFYEGVLGLAVVGEDPFALVLDANGTTVRVVNVGQVPDFRPAPFTILGWQVADVRAIALGLRERGVACERYQGMVQDDLGVWTSPAGARVAWFRDPDGNVLSVTQE